MPPKERDQGLRMPAPLAVENIEEFRHIGVVVEKTGEKNDNSKKNKVMYLFSPTVRKHCGKLVCSVDWGDYDLGDWMKFTQQKNEAYFGSETSPPPWRTRIHPYDITNVQVYVEFFLMPPCISHRTCFNLNEPLTKMWSPQLGGCYVDNKSKYKYQLQEGVVYRGWLQYSVNPINFDEHDQDPEGWPYEPIVYWHLVHCEAQENDPNPPSFAIEIVRDQEHYNQLSATLIRYAEDATEFERQKRITDKCERNIFEQAAQKNRPKMIAAFNEQQTSQAQFTSFNQGKPNSQNNNGRDDEPIIFTKSTFRPPGMNFGPSPFNGNEANPQNSCFGEFRPQTTPNHFGQEIKQEPTKPVEPLSFSSSAFRSAISKPESGFAFFHQSEPSKQSWGF